VTVQGTACVIRAPRFEGLRTLQVLKLLNMVSAHSRKNSISSSLMEKASMECIGSSPVIVPQATACQVPLFKTCRLVATLLAMCVACLIVSATQPPTADDKRSQATSASTSANSNGGDGDKSKPEQAASASTPPLITARTQCGLLLC